MNPRFKYRTNIPYPSMESHTADDGKRVYYTPQGPAPSVTTILSTLPHPGLDEWKERVGPEEAARISKEATDIGNCMHNMLEANVRDEPYIMTGLPNEDMAAQMFRVVMLFGLKDLNEVWGIEVPLHCEDMYAGRTDLVGVYARKASIIDYKSSKMMKQASWLEDYKHQIAAYAIAHDEMFPEESIEQGVILLGTRPNPEYRVPPKVQRVIMDRAEMYEYKMKWLDVVDAYHESH